MKIRKLIYILMITIIILNYCGFSRAVIKEDEKTEVFYDDFSSEKLDMSKWLIAEKAWGGNNGGVVSKNVSVSDGVLKLEAHGNKYEEDVSGINKPDGKKTGAAIATKE